MFEYQINYYSDSNNHTKLPFVVFAMTQQGLEHLRLSIGNQDAGCVYLGKNVIIGAVADGCTAGRNLNGKSHNQVGAYLGSYLAVRIMRMLIRHKHLELDALVVAFESQFLATYKRLLRIVNPWKAEYPDLVRNLLSATLIIFVITEERYVIAHCGDGTIIVNGNAQELRNDQRSVFASKLQSSRRGTHGQEFHERTGNAAFKAIAVGQTIELESLFVATDGFLDEDVQEHPAFHRFFFTKLENVASGFVDRMTEFRRNFLAPIKDMKNGRIWPADDATFIAINRISEKQ